MELLTLLLPQGYWIAIVALLVILLCIGGGKGGGGGIFIGKIKKFYD